MVLKNTKIEAEIQELTKNMKILEILDIQSTFSIRTTFVTEIHLLIVPNGQQRQREMNLVFAPTPTPLLRRKRRRGERARRRRRRLSLEERPEKGRVEMTEASEGEDHRA